jgi:hypothetical protein
LKELENGVTLHAFERLSDFDVAMADGPGQRGTSNGGREPRLIGNIAVTFQANGRKAQCEPDPA